MADEFSTELDLSPVKPRLPGCTFYVAEGVDAGRSWSFRKGVALVGKTIRRTRN